MKKLITLLLIIYSSTTYSQISKENNAPRAGDEIIKQQIEYKNPGRGGENVLWNFSSLKAVNDEYILSFLAPELLNDSIYIFGKDSILKENVPENEELIIGIENFTMHFYHLTKNALTTFGHENPTTLLMHRDPLLILPYPFSYGQKTEKSFYSQGIYSSQDSIYTKGNIEVYADAYGKMIIPTGDTLNHVMRIKTTQFFYNPVTENISAEVETYRWYMQGYRYPIFETIRSFSVKNKEKYETFTTSFFYSPQEHYYLFTDPENLKLQENQQKETNQRKENRPESIRSTSFTYNFYPNPVKSTLAIEYLIEEDSETTISLYDVNGRLINNKYEENKIKGIYYDSFDCSELSPGNYILTIKINDEIINQKVIKK